MTLLDRPVLFRLCSRLFIATYGRFPVLGELRSSVAVMRREGGEVLLLQRSDGLGWAFPGGTSWFWETPEQTLRREVEEETGLRVGAATPLFVYSDRHYIPSRISVFEADATGQIHSTWEGAVAWHPLHALPRPFFACQGPILDYLAQDIRS